MNHEVYWIPDAVFYQIYPLGLLGAPLSNDFVSPPINRLKELEDWIPHIVALGCNALYLGPVFESDFHGYDTADYLLVDRRLGTNADLISFRTALHQNNVKLVLDTVFNHTGRNFWAFKDLQANGANSAYVDWFSGVDFSRQSTYGDGFYYDGWYDAYNLVKLNLTNPEVKAYLFEIAATWIELFQIDGLRLDVAEIMDLDFLAEFSAFCRERKADIWLMGEVITGNYNCWANERTLDSTTNYEIYKGLFSSHNDQNYFEIAHTLNRQYGDAGLYKHLWLYNFADNHDTTRLMSILHNPAHFLPLYVLLFTMPGVPSIYYGSEWGMEGIKGQHDDLALRPAVNLQLEHESSPIFKLVQQLAQIRKSYQVLQFGDYKELYVKHLQFAFCRETDDEYMVIAVNASMEPSTISLTLSNENSYESFYDLLEPRNVIKVIDSKLVVLQIAAASAMILYTSKEKVC
jgi:cyclomaltodextrinase